MGQEINKNITVGELLQEVKEELPLPDEVKDGFMFGLVFYMLI
ncbi:MAG: hypothetical protein ACOWWR_17245 [Eubacteriales bacterium]